MGKKREEKELKIVIINPEAIPEAKKKFTKLLLETYEIYRLKTQNIEKPYKEGAR